MLVSVRADRFRHCRACRKRLAQYVRDRRQPGGRDRCCAQRHARADACAKCNACADHAAGAATDADTATELSGEIEPSWSLNAAGDGPIALGPSPKEY